LLNASAGALKEIKEVHYSTPTFKRKEAVANNPDDRFATVYYGWGCLEEVQVRIEFKDGTAQSSDFDMCRSLGPDWTETAPTAF
jgi:hypothetical protein